MRVWPCFIHVSIEKNCILGKMEILLLLLQSGILNTLKTFALIDFELIIQGNTFITEKKKLIYNVPCLKS